MTTLAGAPVVAGVDGSARSFAAVEVAAAEAALCNRPLRIVHAFAWPPVSAALTPDMSEPVRRVTRERALSALREAEAIALKARPELAVTAVIVDESPVAALRAESRHAFLIVLGDRGAGGLAQLLVGSVAVQTASHSLCPVMVIRGERRTNGPVVVGIDGSATSMRALEFAAGTAALRGAELLAVHAWSTGDSAELVDKLPMSWENWAAGPIEERVFAEAVAGLGERQPDLVVRREMIEGPARRILAERSAGAQLMVVGDRGRGGFTGLLLGSVSQYLVHHAACPLVVVRNAAQSGTVGS
ncbi:universal stress protein [Actinoplanes sp. NPDC048967]|uniref:universal stress protein n=1 Tax=Actinoplanes sp. NPDC048967 TaxID=3155269 RepID=UPI0033CD9161